MSEDKIIARPPPPDAVNPVVIKKYANRRLYNTSTSAYVTLDYLAGLVKNGVEFLVYDAKNGDDITRSVLTQIIVEEENKGINLLPIPFLRQLIGFYGDNLQWLVPKYLEQSMQAFAHNQEQLRGYFQNTFGGMFPFTQIEEMGKQNLAMMEQTLRFFNPFGGTTSDGRTEGKAPLAPPNLAELEARLAELQQQIKTLKGRGG